MSYDIFKKYAKEQRKQKDINSTSEGLNKSLEIVKAKKVMKALMDCIKDPKTSTEDKKSYYSEYLQISKNFLILSR